MRSVGDRDRAYGPLPPPPAAAAPPPPPAPPRRHRWRWAVGAVLVLAGGVLAWRGVAGGSSGSGGCPTGRPTARLATFTEELVAGPMPGAPSPSSQYQLTVDFEVRNEASAPVVVQTIEVGVVGQPDAQIVSTSGTGTEIAPGETATVQGLGQVTVDGPATAEPPSPDSGSVEMYATWAEDDLAGCAI